MTVIPEPDSKSVRLQPVIGPEAWGPQAEDCSDANRQLELPWASALAAFATGSKPGCLRARGPFTATP